MNILKNLLLLKLVGTAIAGGSSKCGPLMNKFHEFQNVWLNTVDHVQEYAERSTAAYPVLTPSFVVDLICESKAALWIASRGISRLSGVNSDQILQILNGTENQISEPELDCIADDLFYIRSRISKIMNSVVPALKASEVKAPNVGSNCFEIYANLAAYVKPAFILSTNKTNYVFSDTQAFKSINMADIYQQSFDILSPCIMDIISTGMGAVFNADGGPVASYINGKDNSLPYPFKCIQMLIDIGKPMLKQMQNSFSTGKQLDLVMPTIPNFFG